MGIEYRSKDKCRLVVYAGTDAYGKTIRHIRTVTYTSKRNAEKQYRAFESEILAGLKKDPDVTLSEIIEDYIDSRKRKGLRQTTLKDYAVMQERISDTLGNPVAAKVTRKMVDDWIGQLNQKYSSKTIKNTVCFLSSCYERSITLEQLSKNPCRQAEIPNKKHKPRITLQAEDIALFYKKLQDTKKENPDFVVAIELMLFCGLRRSEVAGLRLCNIDTINKVIHIREARHTIHGNTVVAETKTERSNRALVLPGFVYNDVMELIALHEENSRRDQNLPKTDYLILGVWGEPVHPNVLYDRLKRFTEEYGFPNVTLHGLRHTYASMLKWNGRDLVEISGQLGHSQQSTTLDIYTHLFQDATIVSKSIADELDMLVGNSK